LPRKNIRPFLGTPLIARTIDAARGASVAGRFLVSTDDPEIAQISREHGAEAPFLRPAEIAGDASPVLGAALHALDWIEAHQSWNADWLLLLQPTSPLRTADDIRSAIELAQSHDTDAVVTVSETKSHPFWIKTLNAPGYLRPFIEGQTAPARRQDLPPALALNGMLYLVRVSALRTERTFCPSKALPLVIPAWRALDIDSEMDFLIAEYVCSLADR